MDRTELENKLNFFKEKCSEKGKPLTALCVDPAYPGDDSTSYVVKVQAPWIDEIDSCYEALEFLNDILFETTDVDTRKKIFAIHILNLSDRKGLQKPQVHNR